ncbi:hypothetical protein ACFV5N_04135, partial [Streptomyces sp. NPDC059853]|uniref:hypothetical protein n=1 Tax=Streptomyces sp. NPDC059853 TaxID=3346973 RepID=UPI003650B5DC
AQASCLDAPADPRRADALFTPEAVLGPLFGHATGPFADDDPVTAGTAEACAALARHTADPVLTGAAGALRAAGERVRAEAADALDPRSLAGQQFADRYARLFAATCVARTALAAGETPPWLGPGLLALLEPGRRMPRERAAALWDDVLAHTATGSGARAGTGTAEHPLVPAALARGGEAR